MPDKRAAGQSLVGCHVDRKFLDEIDRARGSKSRSDFLREAIYKYLGNTSLPPSITHAPDRAGKGGRRRKVIDMLADESSAKVAEEKADQFESPPRQPTTYPKGPARKKGKQE